MNKCTIQPTIISVSKPVQIWLKKKGIYSKYIPNGIDMKKFIDKKSDLRKELSISANSSVILYASRLEYKKYNICKLLKDAFEKNIVKEFPKAHLLIAGGGMKTDQIIKRIGKRNSSSRIQYIGNRVEMSDLYAISDYVVGTGRVALEAICCERPVIAIGTYGTFGLVKPENFDRALKYYFCNHKGYLPLDIKNVTNAVKRGLLYEDKSKHSKVLREKVQQRFDLSQVTKEINKIYNKKLKGVKGL